MSAEIVFYGLDAKVLERASDVPEGPRQVVYYSLAIGHHIGVFDCFRPAFRCDEAFWQRLLDRLPPGEAKRKLEGIARFGEIVVDRSHTRLLSTAFAEIRPDLDPETRVWVDRFVATLAAIEAEPAIYLMGRRKP
jgi:hydrogenase-4 component J